MNGIVLILRAVPGSGKTTLANQIKNLNDSNVTICSADDFFYDSDGVYKWEQSKIGEAHKYCQNKFKQAIMECKPFIIVANTNTKPKDFSFYEKIAKDQNYLTSHAILENRHGSLDVHNVPLDTKMIMVENILNNIKLI